MPENPCSKRDSLGYFLDCKMCYYKPARKSKKPASWNLTLYDRCQAVCVSWKVHSSADCKTLQSFLSLCGSLMGVCSCCLKTLLYDKCVFIHVWVYISLVHFNASILFFYITERRLESQWGKRRRGEKCDSYWGIIHHHWHLQNIFIKLYSLSGELLPF